MIWNTNVAEDGEKKIREQNGGSGKAFVSVAFCLSEMVNASRTKQQKRPRLWLVASWLHDAQTPATPVEHFSLLIPY